MAARASVSRVVGARPLAGRHRGGELGEHLLPLVGGELRERLGVRLLDLLGRRGAQQVAVALDGLLVRSLPAAAAWR